MTKRRGYITFSVIGFFFFFFCISCKELAEKGNVIWNGLWVFKLLTISLLGGCMLGSLLFKALSCFEERHVVKESKNRLPKAGILFGLSWLCIMLCWLPGFLAYYPGICAYDFTIQLEQINDIHYNEHHPLFHTLLIKMFLDFGNFIGSPTNALALFALLQMCLLAAVMAGGIALLRKIQVKDLILVMLVVIVCIFPFNWYMSITFTKDTIFTVFMILQIYMLCHLIMKQDNFLHFEPADIVYLVASVFMIIFRNNGRYAMLVLAGVLFLATIFGKKARKLWAKIFGETVLAIVLGSILLSAVSCWTGAVQGDRREMLSMPIQQLARCMIYHGGVGVLAEDDNTMNEADKALINEFILYEGYKNYRADISDPVKSCTNTYALVHNVPRFVSTYTRLMVTYPDEYINAVMALNAGFLSPFDETHAYINVSDEMTGLGYIQTKWISQELTPYGLERASKWEWLRDKLEYFANNNMHLKLPVVKYLMVPGTYLWLYLGLAAWLFVHKKYKQLIPLALILGYYITLFLGPTVQMRYIYPVMVILPYLIVWFVRDEKWKVTPS